MTLVRCVTLIGQGRSYASVILYEVGETEEQFSLLVSMQALEEW